jgi:1-acyl-sn-glycerol-3-phosphate acyltransferase
MTDRSRLSASQERLARSIDAIGRAWHDYEVVGAELIPVGQPCLLVLYHGFMPFDAWFLLPRLWIERGVHVRALTDRWLMATPGLSHLIRFGGVVSASPETAEQLLAEGHPLLVAPGGTREALKGKPRHYRVTWGERLGFARLALRANVPILPVFSENVEELYRSPFVHTRPFQALYERTRWPIVPVVGLGALPFPVKLRTWIGAPIAPRPGETPEALRDRVRDALQALIDAHQPTRPRLLRGLAARFRRTD